LHAFPLELACDRAEFDSGRRSVRKRLLGLGRVRVERLDTLTFIPATTAPSRSQSREKLAVVTVAP
jgi:hypothetical protein